MAISVQTSQSALAVLQTLNRTSDELADAQTRTGTVKVQDSRDNASLWSAAQAQRADSSALGAVKTSLDRAQSISDVAISAGESVSELLTAMKDMAAAATDPSLDAASRTALESDYKALLGQVGQTVSEAEFDGANMLDGSLGAGVRFLADADASAFVTLTAKDMTPGGAIVTVGADSSIGAVDQAAEAEAQLTTSISNVDQALDELGAQARQIESHNTFVSRLSDTLNSGVGDLVDADLAKEGVRLQALQVRQQLGAQTLSIANSAPQIVLSLFKD